MIDDAWREQDLAPFLHRGPKDQTTRLITTRDDRVLVPAQNSKPPSKCSVSCAAAIPSWA